MGEAFAGKTVGKKAMIWGIVAQSIPDIDFIAALWLPMHDNLLAHRGFTHSILFALIITPFLAGMAYRIHRPHNISFARWCAFIGAVVLGHIFIDAFNNYGVGWFEPFSHKRISFNSIYVVDPFFSILPAIAFLLLLIFRRKNKWRNMIWKLGLFLPACYLSYSLGNKWYVTQETRKTLALRHIHYNRLLTTPAPLQTWLWFVVAEQDSGFVTTYRSVFDDGRNAHEYYFPRNEQLRKLTPADAPLAQLTRFSQGWYTFEKRKDTLLFNDLRFGQVTGWQKPDHGFAFYYYLLPPLDNLLAVQRGRFANWNNKTFWGLLKRVKGERLQNRRK